jgi:hypothetical protein
VGLVRWRRPPPGLGAPRIEATGIGTRNCGNLPEAPSSRTRTPSRGARGGWAATRCS